MALHSQLESARSLAAAGDFEAGRSGYAAVEAGLRATAAGPLDPAAAQGWAALLSQLREERELLAAFESECAELELLATEQVQAGGACEFVPNRGLHAPRRPARPTSAPPLRTCNLARCRSRRHWSGPLLNPTPPHPRLAPKHSMWTCALSSASSCPRAHSSTPRRPRRCATPKCGAPPTRLGAAALPHRLWARPTGGEMAAGGSVGRPTSGCGGRATPRVPDQVGVLVVGARGDLGTRGSCQATEYSTALPIMQQLLCWH